MDRTWTTTEFDLTRLELPKGGNWRETAIITAILVALGLAAAAVAPHWNDWFGWAAPWLTGLIVLAVVAVAVIGFIEQTRERKGIGAAADVSGQFALEDIPGEQ